MSSALFRRTRIHGPQRAASLLLCAFVLTYVRVPFGYCLERTCEDSVCDAFASECSGSLCARGPDGCISDGLQLKHIDPCLHFAVEVGAGTSFGLSDAELESLIAEAFGRWSQLDCGAGAHPHFVVQKAGLVASSQKFFCDFRPHENLSVWRAASACGDGVPPEPGCWGYGEATLGYTSSTFAPDSGVVFDADVELNIQQIIAEKNSPSELREVLVAIATHEAGHFLGIAHSNVSGGIMTATDSLSNLRSKSFHQDDVDAICAAFPPQEEVLTCEPLTVHPSGIDAAECVASSEPSVEFGGGCHFRSNKGAFASDRFIGFQLVTCAWFLVGCRLRRGRRRSSRPGQGGREKIV